MEVYQPYTLSRDMQDIQLDPQAPSWKANTVSSGPGGQMKEILEDFGLKVNPFVDSVNPGFFYRTEQHERAYFRMRVCISDHRAVGLVAGPSGTGKTLLSQMLLKEMDHEKFLPLVILCLPKMTKTALLREILGELEEEAEGFKIHDLLAILHHRIIEEYHKGRRVVLLVDEAHFLSAEGLHMVRTLSNLETPQEKLLTTILFAESSFLRRLNHRSYSSLRGRIALRGDLQPLNVLETEQFLKYRVLVAGAQPGVFADDAYEIFQSLTGGIPREILKLAYNSLLEAHLLGRTQIDAELLRHCQEKGW
jgi:general secretion pathway protein A